MPIFRFIYTAAISVIRHGCHAPRCIDFDISSQPHYFRLFSPAAVARQLPPLPPPRRFFGIELFALIAFTLSSIFRCYAIILPYRRRRADCASRRRLRRRFAEPPF